MSTSTQLDGLVALVTGASRGIGAEIARRLDADGARVVVSGRDRQGLDDLAAQLDHDPVVIAADLETAAAPLELVDQAIAATGSIHVLVNNAGIFVNEPSGELSAESIDRTLAVNVRAPLLIAGRLAAHMAAAGGGSIINLGSVVGDVGVPWASAYAASKAAVDGFTRALAAEWGSAGVRVNAVRPGITRSTMTSELLSIPGFERYYQQNAALGRIGESRDVAELIAFFASDASAYLTAQTISIDGGWSHTANVLPPTT